MIKWFFCLTVMSVATFTVHGANLQEEAQNFAKSLSKNQAPSNNEMQFQEQINQKIGIFTKNNPVAFNKITDMFDNNMEEGDASFDPIQHYLTIHRTQQSQDSAISDTKNLLTQKHRWQVNEGDTALYNQIFKKRGDGRIVTCRESVKGEIKTCIKRRIVALLSSPEDTKLIKGSFSGELNNGTLLGIDLKTGEVVALDSKDHAKLNHNHNDVNYYLLEHWFKNNLASAKDLTFYMKDNLGIEASSNDLVIKSIGIFKDAKSDSAITYTLFEEPTFKNSYVAKIGLIHSNWYNTNLNLHHQFKYDFTWKVTIPPRQTLVDSWQGCEDLEFIPSHCKEVDSQQLELNDTRSIKGYPLLVTRPFWAEKKSYQCNEGELFAECEQYKTPACEQTNTRCLKSKDNNCIEYEQSYKCGDTITVAENKNITSQMASKFLKGRDKELPFSYHDPNEFGSAIAQFDTIKSINSKMQDNLSGISGSLNNPSVFLGLPRHCKVTLGADLKDCCHLKGIAQGVLGGCGEEEKQLADAAVKDKRCHKVASKYCSRKKLGVCIEKKEAYCCYGSQMAKAIQEIAHYQLSIPWGEGKNPQCGSLTAEQLSRLNFDSSYAQTQLAPLFGEFQATAQDKAKAVSIKVNSNSKKLPQPMK